MPPAFTPVNTINQGQVQGYEQQYGQSANEATQAKQGLEQFQQQMRNPLDVYGQQVSKAEQDIGFNPQELASAQKALANTRTTLSNLPQAVQQQGNYYGTTAGSIANNLAQQGANIQGVLAGQSNQVGALGNLYNAALTQGQQGTQAFIQGQQQKLETYKAISDAALQKLDQARQAMTTYETLFQQQGQFNADQARQYAVARSTYMQAQAALASSQAAITQANAAMMAAQKAPNQQQMYQDYMQHSNDLLNLQNKTAPARSALAPTNPMDSSSTPGLAGLFGSQGSFGR